MALSVIAAETSEVSRKSRRAEPGGVKQNPDPKFKKKTGSDRQETGPDPTTEKKKQYD